MKTLASYIEHNEENSSPFHIIILIDTVLYELLGSPLTEGRWEHSSEKGYWQRLDRPHFDHEMLHVHVAQQKHINTKSKQVSWNSDGSRHDRSSFNDNMVGMERAKCIARTALGLPKDAFLECLNVPDEGQLLLESINDLPSKASVYIFRITENTLLFD